MKRIGLIVLMLAALTAVSGMTASAAMAEHCFQVVEAGTGHWQNSECTEAGPPNQYIKVQRLVNYLGQGQWCAEVETGESGNWEDSQCTKAHTGGSFVKVYQWGPVWHVRGSQLKQGLEQLKLQSKGKSVLVGKILLITTEIECKNSISEGATIEGQGAFQGQDKGRLSFTSCKVLAPTGCTVEEPIVTNQSKSYLAYNPNSKQQKFVDVFEPQQGNTFAILKFPGTCAGVAEAKVEGTIAAEISPVEQENQEGLMEFPKEPITTVLHEGAKKTIGLKFANEAAKFSGVYAAKLQNGGVWGVFGF